MLFQAEIQSIVGRDTLRMHLLPHYYHLSAGKCFQITLNSSKTKHGTAN